MDLSVLKKEMNIKPPRIVIFGEEKIGKTTFASGAPNPIFMNVEDGADYLLATRAFQKRGEVACAADATYENCIDLIVSLLNQKHEFGTLVVDTVDGLEMKIVKGLLEEYKAASLSDPKIKEFAYGGSFKMVSSRMKRLLDGFDMLREVKNMCIILIVHSKVEKIEDDPMDDTHLRHVFRLSSGVEGVVKDWADCIVLARQELYIKTEEVGFKRTVSKAIDGGRILCGGKSHAYSGGGRVTLPATMPLSWDGFNNAFLGSLKLQTDKEVDGEFTKVKATSIKQLKKDMQ